jgi:hypothetical protein
MRPAGPRSAASRRPELLRRRLSDLEATPDQILKMDGIGLDVD